MALEKIKEIYNRTAEEYDRLLTPCRMCQFLALVQELNLRGDEKALEIGSGPGRLSIEIGKLLPNGEVVGIDISENMIKLASAKAEELKVGNVKFVVGDALNLKFPDESFDVVVTSQLLHWIPDAHKSLFEIYRVLKTGGKIGLISPTPEVYSKLRQAYQNLMKRYEEYYEGTKTREMIGIRIYSIRETQELLRKAEFKIDRTFIMDFKELLTPEAHIKRIDAITDGKYLDPIPEELREAAKKELMNELLKLGHNDLKTTECSIFIIGRKEEKTR